LRGANSGIELDLTSLDPAVREMGLARVDFIEIDVEGAEADPGSGWDVVAVPSNNLHRHRAHGGCTGPTEPGWTL